MQEHLVLLWFLHGSILLTVSALLFYIGKIKQDLSLLKMHLKEHDEFMENKFIILEDKINEFINPDDTILMSKIIGKQ